MQVKLIQLISTGGRELSGPCTDSISTSSPHNNQTKCHYLTSLPSGETEAWKDQGTHPGHKAGIAELGFEPGLPDSLLTWHFHFSVVLYIATFHFF